MNRQDHANSDQRVDKPFIQNFAPHLLWPVLAVIVIAAIGLFVLSPWADDSDSATPALPTPATSGTPNP